MKNIPFGITSYKYLLDIISNSGRKIINYSDILNGKNGIVMRHDIDFCPLKADKIASLEYKNNVKATYFVLLNSGLYNLKENKNKKALKNILNMGHQVGLHFDTTKYDHNKNSVNKGCIEECSTLEKLIDNKIEMVSFHRPAKEYVGMDQKIGKKNHTYMPSFINNIKYCSDSEGEWKYDDPEDLINDNSIESIQLLTHPIWWTTPQDLSAGEKIAYHLRGAISNIHKIASENCKPYKKYLSYKK